MTQTPLQEAIQHLDRKTGNDLRDVVMMNVVDYLKRLLPKEKEFVEKVFQSGADWATEVLDSYVRRPKEPDVNQFINQLYPEK